MQRHVEGFDKDGADSRIDDADVRTRNEWSANLDLSRKIGVLDCEVQDDWSAGVDDDVEVAPVWVKGCIEDDVANVNCYVLRAGRVVFNVEAPTIKRRAGIVKGDFAPNDCNVPFGKQEEFVPRVEIAFSSVIRITNDGVSSWVPIRVRETNLLHRENSRSFRDDTAFTAARLGVEEGSGGEGSSGRRKCC